MALIRAGRCSLPLHLGERRLLRSGAAVLTERPPSSRTNFGNVKVDSVAIGNDRILIARALEQPMIAALGSGIAHGLLCQLDSGWVDAGSAVELVTDGVGGESASRSTRRGPAPPIALLVRLRPGGR